MLPWRPLVAKNFVFALYLANGRSNGPQQRLLCCIAALAKYFPGAP